MYIQTLKSSWLNPTNGFSESIPSLVAIRRVPPSLTRPVVASLEAWVQLEADSDAMAATAINAPLVRELILTGPPPAFGGLYWLVPTGVLFFAWSLLNAWPLLVAATKE